MATLLSVWGPAAGARAQSDAGAELRARLRTSVELVLVPVTVKTPQGDLVTDLTREDFRVFEDGVAQSLRYFSADPFPLSAVVLVDRGLDREAQQAVEEALPALATLFGPDDEFALYTFEAYPQQVLDFTHDREALSLAVQKLKGTTEQASPPAGTMATGPMSAGPRVNTVPVGPGVPRSTAEGPRPVKTIHDALFAAGLALRGRERGRRRVVVMISDGRNSRLNVRGFEETRDLLLAEDASVYAAGVGISRFAWGTTVLSDYAAATGGDVYAPLKEGGLTRALARVTEQARYQYTLVYAARAAPASREYRRIRVEVNRPNLTVRAREGYFAGLPEH